MEEIAKLKSWMNESGHSLSSLAKAMGYSYDGIYQAVNVRSFLSPHFKWRFAQVFGWEVAQQLFDQPEPTRALELA